MKLRSSLLLNCCALVLLATPLAAQQGQREGDPPVKLTLYPAAAPVPALKYSLLPRYVDQIEGNAAVYYGKVTAEQIHFFSNKEIWEKIDRWENETPLKELKGVTFREVEGGIMHHLDLAARCEHCDWQIPVRHERFYTILLPEVQQTRSFGRILATHARVKIANGEYVEALADMRRGYALARQVAQGETLINGLVGVAIGSIISEQVHTMVQQPDAPNLYWALTELPDPLIDLRPGILVEMNAIEMSFPELKDLESAEHSPEYWRELLMRIWGELGQLSDDATTQSPAQITAIALSGYPKAKRVLIEQGFDAERVEKMPVAQVVLLYTMRTYHELRDEVFKWFFVPYPVGSQGEEIAAKILRQAREEHREILPVASMLLPAIGAVRTAQVRMSQRIELLRVLEALRMHAAANNGKLPASLDEVTLVPIPLNPATGKSFNYRLEGETAYLSSEPLVSWQASYEITMAKK